MTLLADAGDRAAAMSVYVRLEDRLERELSVAPSRQTRRLLAEIRAGAAPPLGTATEPRLPPVKGPLAGRDAELRTLTDATRAVLLAGEPGIGKTRLLAEAGRLVHKRGRTVLYGRCYEEQVAPYEPFAEALGAETFARLLADAHDERWRLFEAIGARVETTVLLLDDLHWADAGTLRLLAHLLRRPKPPVVLGAYRDTEIARTHPLAGVLADLRREGLVERVPLRGLDATAVADLVGDADRAATLHRETGGNPFFIEQVLVADDGAIPEGVKGRPRPPPVAAGSGDRPRAVRRGRSRPGVRPRVARGRARGRRAACTRGGGRGADGARAGTGRYAFAHALVRETLYDELSLTRRVRTHRALADALVEVPGHSLAELAHRRLQADAPAPPTPRSPPPARRCARSPTRRRRACANGRSRRSRRAPPRRAATSRSARRNCARENRRAEAFKQAAALARTLPDPELFARAALGFSGLGVTIIAVDREAVALLEEALEGETSLRARLVARLAIETYYESTPERRKALGDEAVARARADELLDALDRSPRGPVERAVPRGAARHRERDARAGDRARRRRTRAAGAQLARARPLRARRPHRDAGRDRRASRRSPSGCGCRATRGGHRCGARRWRSSKAASPTPRP